MIVFVLKDARDKIPENLTDFATIAIAIVHLDPLMTGDKTA
jgi:hypothetical protein